MKYFSVKMVLNVKDDINVEDAAPAIIGLLEEFGYNPACIQVENIGDREQFEAVLRDIGIDPDDQSDVKEVESN